MMVRYRYAKGGLEIDRKWFLRNPLAKQLTEIIQRELNYEKTTVASGHVISRFGRVYRKKHGYSWGNDDNEHWCFKKGILIHVEKYRNE